MTKIILATCFLCLIIAGIFTLRSSSSFTITGAPPYAVSDESEVPTSIDPYDWIRNWKRPEGPAKVAIQIGHWQHQDAPEEQKRLRNNSGASAAGVDEVDINTTIAQELAQILQAQNIQVEILPVTIPPGYWADVFISIHADGSTDSSASGFKFAGPWRDFTGHSDELVSLLESNYAQATNLDQDPNITRNMRGYYAFSWWRYDHAVHPMTTAVIAETGFVTNPSDRQFLTTNPEIPAQALADAIVQHLSDREII